MPYFRKKVQDGLPVVGFSAGTILCGPNILTSNDINMPPTMHFDSIGATPFNFYVHYPKDEPARSEKDGWLAEYHVFHDNPIIIMEDGAYVKVESKKTSLVRGNAWILRQGHEKEKLDEGKTIPS
jgi:dipeptidase E